MECRSDGLAAVSSDTGFWMLDSGVGSGISDPPSSGFVAARGGTVSGYWMLDSCSAEPCSALRASALSTRGGVGAASPPQFSELGDWSSEFA